MADDDRGEGGRGRGGLSCRRHDPDRALAVQRRVHEKIDDYASYGFTDEERLSLTVFFDLAQEFSSEEDFYTICVAVPKVFFSVDANLYLFTEAGSFRLVRCSAPALPPDGDLLDDPAAVPSRPTVRNDRFLIPIRGNHELIEQLPFTPPGDVIGLLEIFARDFLEDHRRLFFEKFANRVGFQLHNRIIRTSSREHLEFIRNLVADIGHNVIVPNMYFKLFYNRLKGKIDGVRGLADELAGRADWGLPAEAARELRDRLEYLHDGLASQFAEIYSHYEQTSLFLETLLRRRHFEEGRYVLEKRSCNLRTQIIEPQLERYRSRMEERGIEVDLSMGGVPDRELRLTVDLGLISQVYANLFSNAVKYTRKTGGRKFVAYGWDVLPDRFGPGRQGVKLNVFSSGPHVCEEDRERLFLPGFRGRNVKNAYGTGHGLHFVRQVVEMHGGEAGYEPKPDGNNFFIVLPFEEAGQGA